VNILLIAYAFPPREFSEAIVNGKLALALLSKGHQLTIISKNYEGPYYNKIWSAPWEKLKDKTIIIKYNSGNKIIRLIDTLLQSLKLGAILPGIRWAGRAYSKAITLHTMTPFQLILTRSPVEVAHIVGYNINKKTKIKWMANWNDPINGIWPSPYEKYNSHFHFLYYHLIFKKILDAADVNSFPSTSLMEHFIWKFNIKTNNTTLIPHIQLPDIKFPENNVRRERFRLCHAGNLSEERNPEFLFQALVKIKKDFPNLSFELIILGIMNEDVKTLILRYHLEETVIHKQPLNYLDALEYMNNCDLLVLIEANLKHGIFLPSKISDYAQVNVPILALSPASGEVEKLISNYGGGIRVENLNTESIYKALNLIFKIFASGNSLSSIYSTERLKEYHSERRILDIYNKQFNELLNNK